MCKFEKKKPRKLYIGVIIALVLMVMVSAAFVLPRVSQSSETEPVNSEPEVTVTLADTDVTEAVGDSENNTGTEVETTGAVDEGKEAAALQFPCLLEDGALEIESIFQFDGINPDCGNRDGDRTAALLVRNLSGSYLNSASVWVELSDGTEIVFSVSHLPAGKTALAFSVNNEDLPDDGVCSACRVDAVFEEDGFPEGLSVTVNETDITVTNETGEEMTRIDIYSHGVFGDLYYGGVTYICTIESLPAGGAATVSASDCMIGVVEVVKIVRSEEK